jgi:O-Antigen ligase
MSAVRLTEILLRNPGAIETLRASPSGLRISPQIPDYIAAGSYFSLCWVAAVGLAIATASRMRIVWVGVSVPLAAALYLTGSRSVVAAAVVGLIVLVVLIVGQRAVAARGVLAFAAVAMVVMVGSYSWMSGRDMAGEMAKLSISIRAELLKAGLRVIETRPLFGVGLDRFYIVASSVASDYLRVQWPGRMNPHNDLLRFGGELGLVGLALFLWILSAAALRVWRALPRTRDPALAGVAAGLAAFLVTSMVSNPLMVREVSYAFWIALGLAVGRAAGPLTREPDEPSAPGVTPRWLRVARLRLPVALLLGALLIVSIPSRARQEIANVDLRRVAYGLSDWRSDDGMKWRWSGPTATLFVDGQARLVEIPLRGTLPSGEPQQVEVRVDGQLANRVAVGREWQRLRTLVPESTSSSPRRIDLLISPTWVPAEVLPRNTDRRVLGVRIGEVKVVMAPDQ